MKPHTIQDAVRPGLTGQPAFVHHVDADDRLVFVDYHWLQFASENHSSYLTREAILGQSLWSYVGDVDTRQLYQLMLDKVRSTGEPLNLAFRCDAPDRRRFMEMDIIPEPNGHVQFSTRLLRETTRAPIKLLDIHSDHSDECLKICGWCKQVNLGGEVWVEVEVALDRLKLSKAALLPQLTHTTCPACGRRYFEQLSPPQSITRSSHVLPVEPAHMGRHLSV